MEEELDIIRRIDTENHELVSSEIGRLWNRKRIGFKAHFTRCVNTLARVMSGAMNGRTNPEEEGDVDTSKSTRDSLETNYQKLVAAYEKLSTLHERVMEIDLKKENLEIFQKETQKINDDYNNIETNFVSLKAKLSSQKSTQAPRQEATGNTVKPMQALEPFVLSFDNNPIELQSWFEQYQAYANASKFHKMEISEQHAFVRKSIHPEIWTAIRQSMNEDTPIYNEDMNATSFQEMSVFDLIKDQFDIKYPIITRRLEFFNSKRQGNQSFSDWYAKLRQMANSAAIEDLRTDELLIMRICTGINDQTVLDRILAIPNEDFKLEEIHRLCVRSESARNFQKLSHQKSQSTHFTSKTNYQNKKKEDWASKYGKNGKTSTEKPKVPNGKDSINKKLDDLAKKNRCFRCGQQRHKDMKECKATNATCNKCQKKGHLSPVCGASTGAIPKNFTRHTTSHHPSEDGPTPTVTMKFENEEKKSMEIPVIIDTGSTTTIFSKNVLSRHKIAYRKTNERLFNASGSRMTVNGMVTLSATFRDKTVQIEALVSEDIDKGNKVLFSFKDSEAIEAIKIARSCTKEMTEEKIKNLKKKYSKILKNELTQEPMKGPEMKIHFKKDVTVVPAKIYTAAQQPIHLKPAGDKAVKEAIKMKIIEELEPSEPSTWCSRGFFVMKGDGDARLVVDYSPLNKFVERPTHPFLPGNEILKNINPSSKVFAKLDAVKGYHQIPLDNEAKKLTTFLLPSGRYRYLRAPMGLSSSSDEWCKRSDMALAGIPGVQKLVDDILVEGVDYEDLLKKIEEVLKKCLENNITISLHKMEIGEEVTFAGYKISKNGVVPEEKRTQAITDFPVPKTKKDLKSFLGLAQTLAHFVPDLSQTTDPIRQLLRKNVVWLWTPEMDKAFEATKKLLTGPLVLRAFSTNRRTELITDASRVGLGFVMVQDDPQTGNKHLVAAGSRALTDAETRYAVCELEGLAISYAISKCSHYLMGHPHFQIITDHKPLIGTWKKEIPQVNNVRLRRYREKTAEYSFDLAWREGKLNLMADALSRAPVFPAKEEEETGEICNHTLTNDPILEPLIKEADNCKIYQQIKKAVTEVKNPKKLPSTHPGRQLNSVWSDLSIQDGLIIVEGTKIFVPEACQKELLKTLHLGHCGTNKTIKLAKSLYYWRGMATEIKQLVHECQECRPFLASQPQEQIIPGTSALGPMDSLGSDLFQIGKNQYLLVVDRYSGFPLIVEKLTKLNTKAILEKMEKEFNVFGWPRVIKTDNGPQYRSEFDRFCNVHNIKHETSSPHFSQSNGLSEAAVKQMKHLMKKTKENLKLFAESKLEWVNTPNESGKSPAQMFFGRKQRTKLPHLPDATKLDPSNAIKGAQKRKKIMTQPSLLKKPHLSELEVGQKCIVQDPITLKWDKAGRIVSKRNLRSYQIKLTNNKLYIRNRKFVRPDNSKEAEEEKEEEEEKETEDQERKQKTQERIPRRSKRIMEQQTEPLPRKRKKGTVSPPEI